MAKLIKIDRNGSKHFEGLIKCERCGGSGVYAWRVENGKIIPTIVDNGVCHKCGGSGKVKGKWIERTPEYQAKLDARREAKIEAERARLEAIRKEREAEEEAKRKAEEERIKALKAISQHVGIVGERITAKGSFVKTAWFEVPSFAGYGMTTMYIHTFKDADGNVFIWKTSSGLGLESGEPVNIKGTVKEHSEYQDEKQTVLTRCKVEKAF